VTRFSLPASGADARLLGDRLVAHCVRRERCRRRQPAPIWLIALTRPISRAGKNHSQNRQRGYLCVVQQGEVTPTEEKDSAPVQATGD
jgi:hypothetical protein